MARTILAMGGGGFTMEPDTPALDDFVLTLPERREPRILFLPTASGDPREQIGRFHAAFDDRPCEPSVLSLFRLADLRRPLRDIVLSQDVVYVGGGSMRNLLAIWRVHGLDTLLREAWERGIVLAGLSAGAMCWFEGGVTTSFGAPEPTSGLGLLPGSLSVHGDGQPARRPVFLRAVADGTLPAGYLVDDGVGLVFADTALQRAVASRPQARATRVESVDGRAVETPVLPHFLGRHGQTPPTTPFDIQEFRRARYGSSRRD
jgi:dipeptidase E